MTTSGQVSIDASGKTTIAEAGDITAGGAVTFGANKSGTLTTAGEVTTTDDNVTFTNAVTLQGDVDIDTGSGGGDISFSKSVDGVNALTLKTGTGNAIFTGEVKELTGLTVDTGGKLTTASSVSVAGDVSLKVNTIELGSKLDAFTNDVSITGQSGRSMSVGSDTSNNIQIDNTELSNITARTLTLETAGEDITVAGLTTGDLLGLDTANGLKLDTGSGAGDISFVSEDSTLGVSLTTSSGTGSFIASAGIATGTGIGLASGEKLSITANDFTIGAKLNSGSASTGLSVFSADRNLDLAGGDQGDGADISGAELALITATDLTVKTTGSSGAIKTGSGITDTNTENITGTFKIASGGDFTSSTDTISTASALSIACLLYTSDAADE